MAQDKSHQNFRPLGDRVLIERVEKEERSAGGIIIPDSAKEKPREGKVKAVGNGKRLDNGQVQEVDLEPGDVVLFGPYSGSEIKIGGVEHLILREEEVLGILG